MSELTTAQRIFNIRYAVVVPLYATEGNPTSLKLGVARSKNTNIAEMEAESPCYVNYPVWKLAVLSESGVAIRFQNPKDTLAIYEDIKAHLTAWHKATQENVHKLEVPMESLRQLDDFASRVYPIARQWMAVDIRSNVTDNPFVNFMNSRSGRKDDTSERIEQLHADHDTAPVDDLAKAAMRRTRRR